MLIMDLLDQVEVIELAWVPMPDGRKLAARLFLPRQRSRPVPAILEYIPYRRRDGTRLQDEQMHIWFAAHGHAGVRVDIAGMGDSEGIVEDEYAQREQDDALAVIEWLGSQAWCSGSVGMIGISWGGFNALQVAARRPARLKAVITMCSSDDRYGCDAHYLGGCLLNDNFAWGGAFFNYAVLPPDPAMVGEERWRKMWKERIDRHVNFPALWLRHQRRDEYWKHGSICEDWAAINCAVFAVGGWLDGYTQTVFRLVENLKSPCKGLIGPWGHKEPYRGVPGPAVGFLQECLRWWDHYLKGEDRGIERDPDLRVWIQDYETPQPHFLERRGRWISFSRRVLRNLKRRRFYGEGRSLVPKLSRRRLSPLFSSSPQTTGLRAQEWCPYGQGRVSAESAGDQREDDGLSLCMDSDPLASVVNIVGEGRVKLRIAANQTQALIAVRLCDVAPDGTSALITYGLLNLSHRSVGQSIDEVGELLGESRDSLRNRAGAMLRRIGLAPSVVDKYPYQLSGGQARRVALLRALLVRPQILIADEPTAGLDVSIQGDLLNLLQELRRDHNLTLIVVSHNLAVVRLIADHAAVMYQGRVAEQGLASEVFDSPSTSYMRQLLAAWPRVRA
jgi:predicted acyl esterase